jgi:hypothetical protein
MLGMTDVLARLQELEDGEPGINGLGLDLERFSSLEFRDLP